MYRSTWGTVNAAKPCPGADYADLELQGDHRELRSRHASFWGDTFA